MKICYIRTELYAKESIAGGAVTHSGELLRALKKLGHCVFSISPHPLPYVKEVVDYFYTIKPFIERGPTEIADILYNLSFYRKASQILEREKPDFIYQRYLLYSIAGVKVAKKLKIPIIMEFNGSDVRLRKEFGTLFTPEKFAYFMERKILKQLDVIVTVSRVLKEELLNIGIPMKSIYVIPNAVDPIKFTRCINGTGVKKQLGLRNKIVVGYFGAFHQWQGVEVLVEAFKRSLEVNKNLHLLLVGTGELYKDIKSLILVENIAEAVTLTGVVPFEEVPKYMALCDICTAPFLSIERFFFSPIKIFEYMAMGKAIIGSNIGQIGEVLRDGESAILVKPGNKNLLSEAILSLAANPQLRGKLGNSAMAEVERYTWQSNAKHIIEIYQKMRKK